MVSLKKAIEQGKLDQFIAEHRDEIGNEDTFNRAVQAMTGKSPRARPASREGNRDD